MTNCAKCGKTIIQPGISYIRSAACACEPLNEKQKRALRACNIAEAHARVITAVCQKIFTSTMSLNAVEASQIDREFDQSYMALIKAIESELS